MTTFAASLKKEIARVARKELRDEISALRKGTANYKSETAELKRKLKSPESQDKALGRVTSRAKPAHKAPTAAPRRKPGRIVAFGAAEFLAPRTQFGFTQAQMGKLIGASSLSIYKWESGSDPPSSKKSLLFEGWASAPRWRAFKLERCVPIVCIVRKLPSLRPLSSAHVDSGNSMY